MRVMGRISIRAAAAMAVICALAGVSHAQEKGAGERVSNAVAEFAGLDKITGRIISFDVYIDETVQFGALQVTPRVCYSRPGAEAPKTDSFVEVDEITLDRKIRRIFTGWMFAESPGLNAVEHAVYDVWLKDCKQKSEVPAPDTAGKN
ncbi:glycosyl hydrolase family 5 [Aquamicrobium defluvii]|uniref:Glycosyl hydrolase family 5 n=2 Tax=Aquamicrobium defluvii TaxID=69279 RepID=A0A011VKS8_9HYPH|nr:glycosyl hydrolase family 5 [Aquamicrobium defluvii]EZQ15320.1 glycosyl hydrolase family 5 [Halopseudomonas bauzanensis]